MKTARLMRVYEESHRRLKAAAALRGKTMVALVDELSKDALAIARGAHPAIAGRGCKPHGNQITGQGDAR